MTDRPRHLTPFEKDTLLSWFLHNMSHDTRCKLMGQLPVIYAVLFQTVAADTLAHMVEREITAARGQRDPIEHRTNL